MEEQEELPLLIIKKLFISLMVILLVSFTIGCGASSYAMAADQRSIIIIVDNTSTPSHQLFFEKAILTLKSKLQSEGYKVIDSYVNYDKLIALTNNQNVRNTKIDLVLESCEATIAATVITIDTKSYYFKDDADASALIKILENNNISFTKEEKVINYKQLSKSRDIENQIDDIKKQAAEKAKQKKVTVSRSSSSNRTYTSNTSNKFSSIVDYHYISSVYGWRHGKMHTGIDLAANYGNDIHCWKAGVVTFASWRGNYGKFIIVEHYDGTISRYAHLNNYAVAKGDIVDQGQTIGYVGTTGNSTRSTSSFRIISKW